jgi:peptide/nickel transport system substrate-binding protein
LQLEAGEIEVGRIPATEFERLDAQPHLRGVLSPENQVWMFYFNQKKPEMQNKTLREALYYGLDREALLDAVFAGLGRVVDNPAISPPWAEAPELVNSGKYPYDPEKAKQLLEEAGWDFNKTLTIMVGPWTDNVRPAEAALAQWTNLGLRVELRTIPVAVYGAEHEGNNWDIGWNQFYLNAGPSGYATRLACDSSLGKRCGYCNPEMDAVAAEAAATADEAKRGELYKQVAQMLFDDLPVLSVYATGTPYIVNEGLKGTRLPASWISIVWNIEEWHR